MPNVERLWTGETCVIVASGPSITSADVSFVRGKARVLAINNSYQMAPWADALYAADTHWWQWHKGAPAFQGLKFTVARKTERWPDVHVLKQGTELGLSDDPGTICLGRNSGYQAINLSVLLGCTRLILLGYDMQRGPTGQFHWHKEHPFKTTDHYVLYRKNLQKMAPLLRDRGISVVNCSRRTALTCFPCSSLESVFAMEAAA